MSGEKRDCAKSSEPTQTMEHDDDLRARFRALANEDSASTPSLSETLHRRSFAGGRRSAWYSPGRLAAVGVGVVGVLAALTLGLVWGANTGYASARVEGQRERREIAASAMGVAGQLAALRLDLARTHSDLTRRASDAGASSRASLLAASAEVRRLEATVERMELDLAQGRQSGVPIQASSTGETSMKRALALTCGALALAAPAAPAQQGIPVVDLPPAASKTASTLGAVLDVREVSGGKLIVNDGVRHQMRLLDSSLTTLSVPIDSVPGNANSYGFRPLPLVRFLGDSLLTPDANAGTMLVLSPAGQPVRAIASPMADFPVMLPSRGSGFDDKGRMLFEGFPARPSFEVMRAMSESARVHAPADSAPIVRADLETRRVDTVGRVVFGGVTQLLGRATEGGPLRFTVRPIETLDDWAILSDGSIAILRGQDYHIDWIHADGTKHSTTKLPFDWKRLTDEDKQRLIDSTRVSASAAMGRAMAPRPNADGAASAPGPRRQVPADPGPPRPPAPVEYVAPDLKDLPDYYPAIRRNAVMPDLDGNLWILPTSSAQSKQGELVYDVVNVKGDFHRVRVPLGRSIAGFGKGGVVYLQSGDRASGFYLERTRLPAVTKPSTK